MKNIGQLFRTGLNLLAIAAALLIFSSTPAEAANPSLTVTPSTISNTYNGTITLQIDGLNTGETVIVQKYLDVNKNGTNDANDWLVQQFNLTDGQAGMVIGGVTNSDIPGDTDPTVGQISASLKFFDGDISQTFVGQYLYKVSSPTSRFPAIVKTLAVTNLPYAQKITGTVVSNGTSTVVPYAVVLLTPASSGGNGGPTGGVVANASGVYSIAAPPGGYSVAAVANNYVGSFATAPQVTLGSGATLSTNLTVTNATSSISGTLEDANNSSVGVPGVLLPVQNSSGLLAIAFTDSKGNFNVGVLPGVGQWKIQPNSTSLAVDGYVQPQNKASVAAGATGVIVALTKATALFYGSVQNSLGNPVPGVDIYVSDDNSLYQSDGYTDANGNYFVSAIGGLNNDLWYIQAEPGNDPNTANDIFTQPSFDQNGGAAISVGQAVQANFNTISATNTISGTLKDGNGIPIPNIGINASATINGVGYNLNNANTDGSGFYSLQVANGTWQVNVNSGSGGDSLPSDDFCPPQTVIISNNSPTVNFIATVAPYTISGTVQDNLGNPISGVGVYANATVNNNFINQFSVTDGGGNYSLSVVSGTWQVGVNSGGGGNSLPSSYLTPASQSVVITSSSATANFVALSASHMIFGTLLDNDTNPIPDVDIYASATIDGTNYNQNAVTGANGSYTLNVASGDWTVNVSTCTGCGDGLPASYLAPQSESVMIANNNGDVNFTAFLATNTISGNVKANGTNVIGVGVFANATINNIAYFQNADTDANGNYSLNVANGNWTVYVNCNGGGNDNLDNILGSGNYTCPNNQNATISSDSVTNNFTVQACGGVSITPTMPVGEAGLFYNQTVQASSCNPSFTWQLTGSLPSGFQWNQSFGEISGITTNVGTFHPSATVIDGVGASNTQTLSLTIVPAVQVSTSSLPSAAEGTLYSQQLQASSGVSPYMWSLAPGSLNLPSPISLSANGLLSGTPTNIGVFEFTVQVTDNLGATSTEMLSLTIGSGSPLQITTTSLPSATQNVFYTNTLVATGGTPPYTWTLAQGSTLPDGITIATNGGLSGTAINSGTNSFTVQVADAASAIKTQLLSLGVASQLGLLQVTIAPQGVTNTAKWQVDSSGVMHVTGAVVSGLSIGTHTVSFSAVPGWTAPANQIVTITNGLTTPATGTYVQLQVGSLKVTIAPAGAIAAGRWQVDGTGPLEKSGATVTNLSATSHTVTFTNIGSWVTPPSQMVTVNAGSTNTAIGTYVEAGSVQVTITPSLAIAGGAQWQLDGGTNYYNSGATATNLPIGNHTISFRGIDYWNAPANQTVAIKFKVVSKNTGVYKFGAAGNYNGLFADADTNITSSGMLSGLSVMSTGSFSGKLLTYDSTNSFTGIFNSSGQSTNTILRTAKLGGPLTLVLQVNWNNVPITVSGTVSGTNGGAWTANLTAELQAVGVASAEYTALLLSPGTPPGDGYLLATNHLGAVVVSGALADGTTFSQSVPVSGLGDLPLYANLYRSTGVLLGWIGSETGAPAGNLVWIKEASRVSALYTNGFTNMTVSLQGSAWTNPPAKTAAIDLPFGQLELSDGTLASPLIFNVAVSTNNAVVKLPGGATNILTGTIAPKTGLLTITFGNGKGKATTKALGAVLQNSTNGGGFFLGTTNAGQLILTP